MGRILRSHFLWERQQRQALTHKPLLGFTGMVYGSKAPSLPCSEGAQPADAEWWVPLSTTAGIIGVPCATSVTGTANPRTTRALKAEDNPSSICQGLQTIPSACLNPGYEAFLCALVAPFFFVVFFFKACLTGIEQVSSKTHDPAQPAKNPAVWQRSCFACLPLPP